MENKYDLKVLPICSYCSKIKLEGVWTAREDNPSLYDSLIETYTEKRALSHGICPPCDERVRIENGLPLRVSRK